MGHASIDDMLLAEASGSLLEEWRGYWAAGNVTASRWYNLAQKSGFNATALTAPGGTGAGNTYDRTHASAMKKPGSVNLVNAGAGKHLGLHMMNIFANGLGTVRIHDRLAACAGLSGTSVAAQNAVTPALPARAGNGDGCELWLEVWTQIGNTVATATVSYTNPANTAGRTGTCLIPPTASAGLVGTMVPVALQDGDNGVKSVQTITLSGSTGTAGSFGPVILKPIATCGTSNSGNAVTLGPAELGIPTIWNDAFLQLMWFSAAITPQFMTQLLVAEVPN